MSSAFTRPVHLKAATDTVTRLSVAAGLDRLMGLDPLTASFIAERQQHLVNTLDCTELPAELFAKVATEQLRCMLILCEMHREALASHWAETERDDEAAALEAIGRSEPPFGVTQ